MKIEILPSLLSADMGHLAEGAIMAEKSGADELHLDIMDGNFVPNISMGPDVVKMAKKTVGIPLNVHLMLSHPDKYIDKFADAGSDVILIHIESDCDVSATLKEISDRGIRAGITLNPDTPVEDIYPVMEHVQEVLVMSVHPGFSGQSFIPDALSKLRAIRNHAKELGKPDLDIMIDGGINYETARESAMHGANKYVAGSFLYAADNMNSAIAEMRNIINESFIQ